MKLSSIIPVALITLFSCAPHYETEFYDPVPPSEICETKPAPCVVASYDILIDNKFSPAKRQLVYEAAAEWSIRTGDTLALSFRVIPKEFLYDDADHPGIISVFERYPGDGYLGWCAWNFGAKIYMLESLDNEYFLSVIRHELGHAFHLNHYEGSNDSVMHPGVPSGQDITCQDLMDFCVQWKCESNIRCNPDPIEIAEVIVKAPIASIVEEQVCGLAP